MSFGSSGGMGGWGDLVDREDRVKDESYSEPQLTREEYLSARREAQWREDHILTCRECGHEWDKDEGSFCSKCSTRYGEKQKRKVEIKICSEHGERDSSEQYCARCGNRNSTDYKWID